MTVEANPVSLIALVPVNANMGAAFRVGSTTVNSSIPGGNPMAPIAVVLINAFTGTLYRR